MIQTTAFAQLAFTLTEWTPSHQVTSGVNLRKDSPDQVAALDRVTRRNGQRYTRFAGKVNLHRCGASCQCTAPLAWL